MKEESNAIVAFYALNRSTCSVAICASGIRTGDAAYFDPFNFVTTISDIVNQSRSEVIQCPGNCELISTETYRGVSIVSTSGI